jgi:hypothetical protein
LSTRAAAEAAAPNAVSLDAVLPSPSMVAANLGPMRIGRPANWTLTLPEQQGQYVTIAPPAGVTARGVGYGVLLNSARGPAGQRLNIDDMTTALIRQMQQNNELKQLGTPQPIIVGGVDSRSTFLQSPSPFPNADGQSQIERDWLVTVPRGDGSLIYMVFVAPEADFARFQPAFEAMVKSVQFR